MSVSTFLHLEALEHVNQEAEDPHAEDELAEHAQILADEDAQILADEASAANRG